MNHHSDSLRINEIFLSLQGEGLTSGLPTVFVRLTGCPLRCRYCDTEHAFYEGERMDLPAIVAQVQGYGVPQVLITGGEPLAQTAVLRLMQALCDEGLEVALETSGALDIAPVDPRVVKVMDIKTPGSGEAERNLWTNLDHLNRQDQIKFVITDRADYDWSKACILERRLSGRCELLFSAAMGDLDPRQLAEWIVEDRLAVRFQIQLHKILWGDERQR